MATIWAFGDRFRQLTARMFPAPLSRDALSAHMSLLQTSHLKHPLLAPESPRYHCYTQILHALLLRLPLLRAAQNNNSTPEKLIATLNGKGTN